MPLVALFVALFWCGAAWATTCGPVPSSFPLTQTAVSSNFAALYACINGAVSPSNNPTFTGTVTMTGSLVLGNTLIFPNGPATAIQVGTRSLGGDGWGRAIVLHESNGAGITLQAHDGALYISNGGSDVPGFGGTNLAITTMGRRGVTQQKIQLGPENSGGIGYRMLRVGN